MNQFVHSLARSGDTERDVNRHRLAFSRLMGGCLIALLMARHRVVMQRSLFHLGELVGARSGDYRRFRPLAAFSSHPTGIRHARRPAVLILRFECWMNSMTPHGHVAPAFSSGRAPVGTQWRSRGDYSPASIADVPVLRGPLVISKRIARAKLTLPPLRTFVGGIQNA